MSLFLLYLLSSIIVFYCMCTYYLLPLFLLFCSKNIDLAHGTNKGVSYCSLKQRLYNFELFENRKRKTIDGASISVFQPHLLSVVVLLLMSVMSMLMTLLMVSILTFQALLILIMAS